MFQGLRQGGSRKDYPPFEAVMSPEAERERIP